MAVSMLYDAAIYNREWDMSADHNELKVEVKQDALESTRFGHTNRVYTQAISGISASGSGWFQIDDSTTPKAIDKLMYDEIGNATQRPMTIASASASGSRSWIFTNALSKYSFDLSVGQLGKFQFEATNGNGRWAAGQIMLPSLPALTGAGNGTIYQLGALTTGKTLYANLHVTSFSGTNITFVVNSNDTNDTTTPTARITFTQNTGVGYESKSVAGPITDAYWYVAYTGTFTSVRAVVAVGIV